MSAPGSSPKLSAGDLSGGLASGLVSITGNVAAGVIAFAPLGPEYARYGILAGMFSSIVAGFVASLTGGAPGMIAGPKATTATAVAALLAQLIATGRFDVTTPEGVNLLLSFVFAAVLMAGSVQVLLGAFKAGTIVKFMPYPVVAGIRNTTAVLLISSQLWPLMGVPRQSVASFLSDLGQFQPATLIVGLATAVFALKGKRLITAPAVPVAALLLGTALYYLFQLVWPDVSLGVTLGALPSAIPPPVYAPGVWNALTDPANFDLLAMLFSGALAITVLESILALTTLVSFQSLANRRFDGNRQLVGQGIGTTVGALFGGLPSSGILARAATNYHAGGRTKVSGVVNALTVLVLVLVLAKPFGLLPKAAVAGLIIVIAAGLFDRWTVVQVREALRSDAEHRRDNVINVGVIAFVLTVGVVANLIVAVGAGVVLSIALFVAEMSRSPIRRIRSGTSVRSNRRRDEHQTRLLQEHGEMLSLVELEGTIFFGSCDPVATRLEELAEEGAHFIVVDLRRVRGVDATGYKLLGQTFTRLRSRGCTLAFSHVTPGGERREIAEDLILNGVPEARLFDSTDRALEYFEEGLLLRVGDEDPHGSHWTVAEFGEAWGLDPAESEVLEQHLKERHFKAGDFVFNAGSTGRSMYLLARGMGDVVLEVPGSNRRRRLATFCQGTMIGEMAFLDGLPRAAGVVATHPLEAYELTHDDFERLKAEHPRTAMKLQAAIVRTIGQRLRGANELILELDS